jgi:two-component system sensor histidine kinase NreB
VLEHVYQRQEEERRSIARDLHDGVGQMLTTVLLGVKSAGRAATLDDARQQISEVAPRITETIDELRAISAGLRPAVLDDLGLAPALERLLEDVAQVSGLAGTFEGAALAQRRWPPNVETTVFRVVQEALQNVVKHGQARQVTVRLLEREGSLLCSVVDDGRGFDVGAGHGLTAGRGGVGLSSMRERAELAGGSLDVFSAPGRGTQVTIAIPEVDLAPLRTGTKQGQA